MVVANQVVGGFNKWLGTVLLKYGIRGRSAFSVIESPFLDSLFLLPLSQKLIEIEIYDAAQRAVEESETTEDPIAAGNVRVGVLESFVRPVLLPTNTWADVEHFRFNNRLLKWLRSEFLLAQHGPTLRSALNAHPSLRKSPQLARLKRGKLTTLLTKSVDLFHPSEPVAVHESTPAPTPSLKSLPTSSLLSNAFQMQGWAGKKDLAASRKDMARIIKPLNGELYELLGGAVCLAHVPNDEADLSSLSLEDVLEAVGGHVAQCGILNTLCEEAEIFQLWTHDYVSGLAAHLMRRSSVFDGETIVLDVGAGDGLLAKLLNDSLAQLQQKSTIKEPLSHGVTRGRRKKVEKNRPTVIATDNGSWGIVEKADVELLDVEETIRKYAQAEGKQVIVLCSWMPMNEDWSSIFRNGKVDEYILIGEADDGQCGDNWETWGNPNHDADFDEKAGDDNTASLRKPVPYAIDGYTRHDMDGLLKHQFSRFDCSGSKAGQTVSFRLSK